MPRKIPATNTFRLIRRTALLAALGSTLPLSVVAATLINTSQNQSPYPVGPPLAHEETRVGTFSRMDQLFPARVVRKGKTILTLPQAPLSPQIRYQWSGEQYTIDDYLERARVTGLLIIRNGEILFERYRYDRTATDRLASNSMAKSITSLAIGLALQEGAIASLDDQVVTYVPELSGMGYGQVTIRQLLRMSAGIRFREDYSGDDDLAPFIRKLIDRGAIDALRLFDERISPAGTRFSYASSESLVLGLVVRASTKRPLAEYVAEKIWQPMGAEADASWVVDPSGQEWAFAKFNAVLRDYGRLGCLLANDGKLNGRTIIPRDYLRAATDWRQQPEAFRPGKATPHLGYGYQFWTFPGDTRRFALRGIFGQILYVDPGRQLVVVQTAAAREPDDPRLGEEFATLVEGIVRAIECQQPAALPTRCQ